jgi:hypothetical protein
MNPVTGFGGSSCCAATRTVEGVSGAGSDEANSDWADAAPTTKP